MRQLIAAGLAGWALLAQAQHPHHEESPRDVVSLQAAASREVDNDELVAVLAAEGQGANPAELAATINRTMAEALKVARQVPGVKLRSGSYQTYPRYGTSQRIEGWHASQELRLESNDFAAVTNLIGRLQSGLVVRSMAMRLSPEARRAAEDALVAEAIAAFHARAELVRKAMKAKGYAVRSMNVNTPGGAGPAPMPLGAARAAAAAPVAVEAGASQVGVTVSGSIQLDR